jgi:hypothetical protein
MAWDRIYLPILEKADAFAKSHGKPFTIPQWNLAADHTRSEGFDAPVFIQSMFNYIQDPAHDVAFSCYMEYYHYSRLSPTDGYVSNEPESTEMFHRLFAVPAPAK